MFFRIFLLCLLNGLFAVVWTCDRPPSSMRTPTKLADSPAASRASLQTALKATDAPPQPSSVAIREQVLIYSEYCQVGFDPVSTTALETDARSSSSRGVPALATHVTVELKSARPLDSLLVPVHDWSARARYEMQDVIPLGPHEMFVSLATLEDLARERALRKLTMLALLTQRHISGTADAFGEAFHRSAELTRQWREQALDVLQDAVAEPPQAEVLTETEAATFTR